MGKWHLDAFISYEPGGSLQGWDARRYWTLQTLEDPPLLLGGPQLESSPRSPEPPSPRRPVFAHVSARVHRWLPSWSHTPEHMHTAHHACFLLLLPMLGSLPRLLLEDIPHPSTRRTGQGTLSRPAQPPPAVRDGPGALHPPLAAATEGSRPMNTGAGTTDARSGGGLKQPGPSPWAPFSAGGRAWPRVGSLGPPLGTLVPQGPQTSHRLLGR